jgi:uncharacterized membrane protein YdjX (TVP38/TMEM64 family)
MRVSYTARTMSWSARALIVLAVLAALLVAAVPVALVVGVFMMLFGHVIGGLALFGGSILAAIAAVVIASVTGVQQLRAMIRRSFRDYNTFRDYNVVQLDRGEYDYDVR